jgi:Photosynthesis system II assembly factor YCF48/Putative zinc-finger
VTELPKIVAQRLQTAASGGHPDPDAMTAFVERSLNARERDQVLGHLAQCRDCREVVALSLPQHETALPAPSVRPTWLAWPVLRWSALAACVVVVGAAVTMHRQSRAGSTPDAMVERTISSDSAQQTLQTAARSDTDALSAEKTFAQASEAKAETASTRKKAEFASNESLKGLVATAKPQAPVPAPRELNSIAASTEADSSTAGMSPAYNAMDEAVPGRAKDSLQPSPPGASLAVGGTLAKSAPAVAQSASGANRAAFAVPVALSPRWTLNTDGTLQRSLDSGRSWEIISVAGQTGFRALAADGLEIWVGGAKGALYHSSDAGQQWTQVQPAANGEVLTGDIIGVEFTDRVHGTVTTSGQQKWVTADAGQSWQKQ